MALSTRPTPPPDPPSTNPTATTTTTTSTAAATTTAMARPIFPRPSPPPPPPSHTLPHPHLYQPHPTRLPSPYHPHPHTAAGVNNVVYPLASSGRGAGDRGFLPKQSPVTLPNPNPNPNPNLNLFAARPGLAYQRPQFGYDRGLPDPGMAPVQPGQAGQLGQGFGFIRPPAHLQHSLIASSSPSSSAAAASAGGLVKAVLPSKVGVSQTMIPDSNGYKDVRDRSRDDSFLIIRDRKVRVSEDVSLYALCRSWLRNGYPEESQPHYIDKAKPLPGPLPLAAEDSQSPVERDDDKEEEDEGSVEQLSAQELLQRHIKRAKRVRLRLREERLRRIARYKSRLAFLLPSIVEQHFINDSSAGNGNAS